MSSEKKEEKEEKEEKEDLSLKAKKYSTLVDFQDDFYLENDSNKKKSEENQDSIYEKQKVNILGHWSKILAKEPPKRRTCHTSFIYKTSPKSESKPETKPEEGSNPEEASKPEAQKSEPEYDYLYVIGGIDITEQKQDDIYKFNLDKPSCWEKVDVMGLNIGKIAYHAGAILQGFYYIVGGQDENLTTLNTIIKFNISQENISEKMDNIELELTLQVNNTQKLQFMKKILLILRTKVKDKKESDDIYILETDLEKELLKYLDEDELIARKKDLINIIYEDLKTEDINKLTDSSVDIDKMAPEDLDKNFRPELIQESITKIDEKSKIYFPPLESHTVNANQDETLLIIYGGMTKRQYNRHVYTYDPQTNKAKNLTENLENDKMPPPRQDHAAVIYNNNLYIYGGIGPDSKIYDDMWKFDLSSNTWEEIKTEAQKEKEKKREEKKQNKENQKGNSEDNETEEEELEDEETDEKNKDIRPQGRSGHSMVEVNGIFYIFGGKTGLIKESNEIWRFIPGENIYECINETLLEQFTKEELQRISSENKRDIQKFRWLTRSDIEKRTNPSFNDNKKEEDAKKNKKNKKDQKGNKNKNDKNGSPEKKNADKNKARTKKVDKNENKNGQNKDIEGKYSAQVLCRPNVVKMRKTLIFTSDPEKIKKGLNTLSKDEKDKTNANDLKIKGELPEPRDGQTVCVKDNKLYIFGGDRFKFPFNDLFELDIKDLNKWVVRDSNLRKAEKEKEKEEKKQREEKKRQEKEEDDQRRAEEEERKKKNEEEKKQKEEEEKKDENKDENKEENKEEKQEKDEKKEETKKTEEFPLLRDILQY